MSFPRLRRPPIRRSLRFVSAGLALLTLVLLILHLIERSTLEDDVKADLSARRDALEQRIAAFIEGEARRLLSLDVARDRLPEDVRIDMGGDQPPWYERRVGERNLYTSFIGVAERPAIAVKVRTGSEEGVYYEVRLSSEVLLDAMAEIRPGKGSRVYLTSWDGQPLLRYPEDKKDDKKTQHQKYRRSSEAFEGILKGWHGESTYKDLDDREAVGAYSRSGWFHGGIVVEQKQEVAFAAVRGVRAWHVSGVLLVIVLLTLLGALVVPRARFTADLFRLYGYAKKYWFLVALVLLIMAVYAGSNGVRLALMKVVFDDVLLGKGAGAIEALKWVLSRFAIIIVVMAAASWLKDYLSKFVTQATINDIRCALSAHLLTLDMKFFDRRKAGEIMSRLSNDVNQTRKSLALIFGEFFQEPLMLVGALGAAFVVNWRLTILVFLGFPLLIFPIYKLGRMVKRYSKRRQVQRGVVTEVMLQTVSGVRTVKSFQMEEHENEVLRKASRKLLTQSIRVARTTALSRAVIDLTNGVGILMVIGIGGYMVIYGIAGANVSDLATLSLILGQMYKPVKDLTKTYNKIQESMAGAERIFEILDEKPEIDDVPDPVTLKAPQREISFDHVTFAYDDTPVLRDVNFRIKVGEVVALVGETGAGKSTITDLVARFYDPTSGRVAIDGIDLRKYRIRSVRQACAMVSQDAFLFNASVQENLLYGKPGASEAEVIAAAKGAGIHKEIECMDRGYKTRVGERGTRLSGGQRQRLTIARAILKDAPILILDEATSALDSETEAEVQVALARLMEGRTTFVVAHRLSTIAHADRILVLKDGELVETGTHDELLEKEDGVYQTLHRIQYATTNGG
jgi:subfamily B ATP-binding cassette protein MsbA